MKLKKNENNIYQYYPTTKDYLIALIYFPNFVKLIDLIGKPYERFHQWIIENDQLRDDDTPVGGKLHNVGARFKGSMCVRGLVSITS